MPFGEYVDFADCVKKNSDKDSPGGWCAELHKKITGEYPNEASNEDKIAASYMEENAKDLTLPEKVREIYTDEEWNKLTPEEQKRILDGAGAEESKRKCSVEERIKGSFEKAAKISYTKRLDNGELEVTILLDNGETKVVRGKGVELDKKLAEVVDKENEKSTSNVKETIDVIGDYSIVEFEGGRTGIVDAKGNEVKVNDAPKEVRKVLLDIRGANGSKETNAQLTLEKRIQTATENGDRKFKCKKCGYIGKESEWIKSEGCPKCGYEKVEDVEESVVEKTETADVTSDGKVGIIKRVDTGYGLFDAEGNVIYYANTIEEVKSEADKRGVKYEVMA